jgi:hypothetical protein
MKEEEEKSLFTKSGSGIILVITIGFFLFMRGVLMPHVPSQDPDAVNIVASMTSFCMTGVFWIAANMFGVTWVDYSRRKKN